MSATNIDEQDPPKPSPSILKERRFKLSRCAEILKTAVSYDICAHASASHRACDRCRWVTTGVRGVHGLISACKAEEDQVR